MRKFTLIEAAVTLAIVVILATPLMTILSPRVEYPCLDWATHRDGSTTCTELGPKSISLGIDPHDYMKRVLLPCP